MENQTTRQSEADNRPLFFETSPWKLILLSIVTLGIYDVYWFYKNWKLVKEWTGSDIKPFWRAVFGFFYCHALLSHIKECGDKAGTNPSFSPGLLSAIWIIVSLLHKLPDPYWLVCYLAVFALVPLQKEIHKLNQLSAPEYPLNNKCSAWQIVGVVFAGLFFILVLIGTLIPDI